MNRNKTIITNMDMVEGSSESLNNYNKLLRKRAKKFDCYPEGKSLQRGHGDQNGISQEVDDLCQPI